MTIFASMAPHILAQTEVDRRYPPYPNTAGWSYEDAAKYEGIREGLLEGLLDSPSRHNEPNPVLVRFRKYMEGETLADESWAGAWVAALDSLDAFGGWRTWDNPRDTFHVLTKATPEQAAHARSVLLRLVHLAEASA